MTTCSLPALLRAQLVEWARAARPHEACGLLVGRGAGGSWAGPQVASIAVDEVTLLPNLAAPRHDDRFEIDALGLLEVDHLARQRGLEVVGVWHSHPRAAAIPSFADRVAAAGGWLQVIVGFGTRGRVSLRAWRWFGAAFVEVGFRESAGELAGELADEPRQQ